MKDSRPGVANKPLHTPARKSGSEQVHLRLSVTDAEWLRQLARDRDQTVSAVIRCLLRIHRQTITNTNPPR